MSTVMRPRVAWLSEWSELLVSMMWVLIYWAVCDLSVWESGWHRNKKKIKLQPVIFIWPTLWYCCKWFIFHVLRVSPCLLIFIDLLLAYSTFIGSCAFCIAAESSSILQIYINCKDLIHWNLSFYKINIFYLPLSQLFKAILVFLKKSSFDVSVLLIESTSENVALMKQKYFSKILIRVIVLIKTLLMPLQAVALVFVFFLLWFSFCQRKQEQMVPVWHLAKIFLWMLPHWCFVLLCVCVRSKMSQSVSSPVPLKKSFIFLSKWSD